jgi:RNA recognition motif-containing protein
MCITETQPLVVVPSLLSKSRRVFVGNLPADVTAQDLEAIFARFGRVAGVSLKAPSAHTNRRAAVIKFLEGEAVEAVLNADGESILLGMGFMDKIDIRPLKSKGDTTPPIVPFEAAIRTSPSMLMVHNPYSITGKYEECEVPSSRSQDSLNSASTNNSGEISSEKNSDYESPVEQSSSVEETAPVKKPKERKRSRNNRKYGPLGCNLFIYHLPCQMTESDLRYLFSPFGNLLSCTLFRDKKTGSSKCFAFVSYDNHLSAQAAIQGRNGFPVGKYFMKVQLKQQDSVAFASWLSSAFHAPSNA